MAGSPGLPAGFQSSNLCALDNLSRFFIRHSPLVIHDAVIHDAVIHDA
jgi:hypothetical protein